MQLQQIETAIFEMNADERASLLQKLITSLDEFSSSELEHEWLATAQKRVNDIATQKIESIPLDKVMSKARGLIN